MLRRTMMASAIAALTSTVAARTDYRQTVLRKLSRRHKAPRFSWALG